MNAISWVEVPVTDMDRAIKFYNALFAWELKRVDFGNLAMAWFPRDHENSGSAGSLVMNSNYKPGDEGPLVYFRCKDVAIQIYRVEAAGGKVLRDKTQVSPEFGFMALAIDSEGNRIAFHSSN